MPKSKQPLSLEKIACDELFECVVFCCGRFSAEDSPDEFRHAISVIKENVCSRLPPKFSAEFCNRFLDKFYSNSHAASYQKAALEIIMDTEIVGFRCDGEILSRLDICDAHRLKGLKILDISNRRIIEPTNLQNFYLNDITTFICHQDCTDFHLEIIGRNCPKLEVVKVTKSNDITDEGMRALSPCSELRVVNVVGCLKVTHAGLTHLLSAHEKLEEFSYGQNGDHISKNFDTGDDFDVLSGLDWSVKCPSITRFVFENNREVRPAVDLQAIAAKFPNLVCFQINCMDKENLTPLKSLGKLTGLEVYFVGGFYGFDEVEETWKSIIEFSTFIGKNITTLKICGWDGGFLWDQEKLNLVFDGCPNIEYLRFEVGEGVFVIPPFQKLKELWPCIPLNFESLDLFSPPALKLGEMPSLETLSLREFAANLPLIESIMLDNVKFPNLSVLKTICVKAEDLAEIERIARNNNLDFKVKNDSQSNWYREYRFGGRGETDDELYGDEDDNISDSGIEYDINEASMTAWHKRFDRPGFLVVGPGVLKR